MKEENEWKEANDGGTDDGKKKGSTRSRKTVKDRKEGENMNGINRS